MTRTIAHRGYAGTAPENTVSAVRFAAEQGADLVEVDTMPSADGRVVVFHDSRLDGRDGSRGLTDRSGIVWETPYTEIREATVLDSGESIPTLAEICRAVPEGTGLNIELKHCGEADLITGNVLDPETRDERAAVWKPFITDVLTTLDDFSSEVLFSSFAEGALAALRSEAPDASLAPLVDDELDVALELANRYDADAIHPSVSAFGLSRGSHATVNPDPVERVHEAGYDVNVWTVETWYQTAQLQDIGVDGLIADYPGLDRWKQY